MSKSLKARLKIAAITVATTVSISGALVVLPSVARADTISDLLAQIAALQAQVLALQGGPKTGLNLTADLAPGARGQAVTDLQTALKTDTSIYPEGLVTGFYGSLTTKAVQRFQAKYGIVSSGTPTTTGYGRAGPKTRAKLNEVYGGITQTPPPLPGPVTPGSGLSVSAPTQPSETLAPEGAARLAFTKITLTAASDGDVTVKSLTVKREGLADDAVFAGIILLDEDGIQIGNEKTLNASHQITLDRAFVVKAGTSKTLTLAGNMATSLDNYAGQVAKLSVVAVDAGSAAVSGSLPISGNGMTINASLAIGTFINPTRGATDPGSDTTKEVGTKGFVFSAVKFSAGSGEDVLVKSIRWDQTGSAADSDFKNLKIIVGTTEYDVKTDGKKYWATFGDGISVAKGGNIDIAIKGDIEGGSDRTVTFSIEKKTDIVVLGKLFGYYITPGGGSAGAATDGNFSSNTEPYFNGYDHTIGTGTLRVEKSNAVAAGNVAVDVSNTNLGALLFAAKGEDVQITNMVLHFTFSGTGTSSDVTNVQIVDSNGSVVAGPRDPSSGIVTFTDTWNVPVGDQTYKVQGKLDSSFVTNDTVTVGIVPGNMTVKGVTTGKTITATPASQVNANTQTVRAAALKVSVAPTPFAQNVVRGINGYTFSIVQYDASNSGEDLRITSQAVTFTTSGTADADDLNTCQFFDGTQVLNDGTNVVNPTGAVGADPTATATFNNHLIVPKGTVKSVDVKCNISSNFVADSTISVGIAAGQDTAVTGVTTGVSVTETLTAAVGQTMTVKSGGSFTIARHSSSPTERWAATGVPPGVTDQMMTIFTLHATDEALRLDRIHLNFSSSTASTTDFTKFSLWDGALKIGEGVFAGTDTLATSTLTGDFIIPKDGDRLLTVKADLIGFDTNSSGSAGRVLALGFNGTATTSTRAIGQSSGSAFNVTTNTDVNGYGVRLVKAYPKLTKLAVPSNTLVNGSMVLYRFSVTAPAEGDVSLYKFTFSVSSTTVGTTTNFYVDGYSDATFQVQAYGNNPLNARQVDIVGEDSLNGIASTSATEREVEVYFDPQTKDATNPNAEAIQVPAGLTRYFQLRGTVASSVAGDSILVSLLGDAAYFDRTSVRFLEAASTTVDAQKTNNDFIWSPNTTTTAATTSVDWANGYLVPGLASTNMEQQSFTR